MHQAAHQPAGHTCKEGRRAAKRKEGREEAKDTRKRTPMDFQILCQKTGTVTLQWPLAIKRGQYQDEEGGNKKAGRKRVRNENAEGTQARAQDGIVVTCTSTHQA
jgi:hypothetical protein